MRTIIAASLMLFSIGSATAQDVYDAVFVSDPAVCERAGEADMGKVLFDLQAKAVAPRSGIWVGGELACKLLDLRTHPSSWDVEEIYATARCTGPYIDFIDSVVVTSDSQNINRTVGDTGIEPPAMVEVMSLRQGANTDAAPDADGYAGVYTICDALTAEDFAP